jgi:hypothetical protein
MSELGEIVTSLRSFRSVSLAAVASYIALEEFIMEAIAAIDLEARAIQHRRSKWRSSSVGWEALG